MINPSSTFTFGKPDFLERKSYPDERRVDIGDTATFLAGRHLMKAGFDVSRVSDTLDNLFQETGAYVVQQPRRLHHDYALRNLANARNYTSFNQGIGPTAFKFRTYDYDFFIQDNWHPNAKTTLNLGVRYDYEQLPEPQIPNALLPATSAFPKDKNNLAPRLGVAYDLTGRGSSVLRGGYGIFYGRIINSTISNAITNVGSTSGQLQFQFLPTAAGAPTLSQYPVERVGHAAAARRGRLQGRHAEPDGARMGCDLRTEGLVQYGRLGLVRGQRRPESAAVHRYESAGAVWHDHVCGEWWRTGGWPDHRSGVHGGAPEREFRTYYRDFEHRRVEVPRASCFAFNRRLTNGLQISANYTEARATDNGQSSQTFTSGNNVLNPYDLGLEEATSNFEVRHRFVVNAIWMTAFGAPGTMTDTLLSNWTIAPAFTTASGQPYTGTLTGNNPVAGISTGVLRAGGSNRLPSIGRNTFNLPKTADMSLRVSRGFNLGQGHKIEAMVDIFNLFNRLNYTAVNSSMYTLGGTAAAPTMTYNSTFGSLTNANSNYFVFTPRQVQISGRYTF